MLDIPTLIELMIIIDYKERGGGNNVRLNHMERVKIIRN